MVKTRQTPTTLVGYKAVLNGVSKAFLVKEGSPPKIVKKMEEYRNAGMRQPLKTALGYEAQDVELTFTDVTVDAAKIMGSDKNDDIALTFRSGYQAANSDELIPSIIEIRGQISEFDGGSLQEGELTEVKIKIEVTYYKWTYDGVVVHEFDPMNLLYVFDGEDSTKALREILDV